jgi:hypothetical protein
MSPKPRKRKMPYNADLRCSYCDAKLNMSWFYEAMNECHMDFDFLPRNGMTPTTEEIRLGSIQLTINLFEAYIESKFNKYLVYKVFYHGEEKLSMYDSVWEYLRDKALTYSKKHPQVVITFGDDAL